MTIRDITSLAIKQMGTDKFFNELQTLKEDLEFFQLYLKRNKKSTCYYFKITPVGFGTINVFGDIIKEYGLSESYFEEEYAIYILVKSIITGLYNEKEMNITNEQIKEFGVWLYTELGLFLPDYVSDFVGCSRGCSDVKDKLRTILEYTIVFEDKQKVKTGRWIEIDFGRLYECSECKFTTEYHLSNYCPDCGVKMVKED